MMNLTHKLAKAGFLALALAMLLLAITIGWEALNIGLLASQAEVDAYHFGSEAIVGHGGRRYESKTASVASAVVESLLLLLAVLSLVWAAWRYSKKTVLAAIVVSATVIFILILPL